ncbi:MAG: AMP-binding protein [Flavobacteriia bacterium]|nr:AMP-binding protein [Flavobacteriia bacterium]
MHYKEHSDFQLVRDGKPLERGESPVGDEALNFLSEWRSSSSTIQLQTSGSTGVPKAIEVDKSVMWHSASATISALGLKSSIDVLLALSPQYIAGKMMIVRALQGGWRLHVHDLSTGVLNEIQRDFDFAALVPLQVKGNAKLLNRICCTILGGAPVDGELLAELNAVRTRVFETYGMTETVSHIALKQLRPSVDSAFRSVSGVTFSSNSNSELVIHAPDWKQPELQTTDAVELLDDTSFVWKGRSDFVINSGGVKIHPERVEPILTRLSGKSVYLTSRSDPKFGSKVIAIVEGDVPGLSRDALLEEGLSIYEIPKEWRSVEAFPLTDSGKIKRLEL